MKRFEYKVPGGKLLVAKVQVTEDKIASVIISGDFFLLPETDLEELEEALKGMKADPGKIEEKVTGFFINRKTTIVGASAKDFAYVITTAITS